MSAVAGDSAYQILVCGDTVVDHHIYRGSRKHPSDGGDGTRIVRQHGGAGLTADLLEHLCRTEPRLEVYDATPPLSQRLRLDPAEHHAYATWMPFPEKRGGDPKKTPGVWRVNETLGFGVVGPETSAPAKKRSPSDRPRCDVLAIDEGGLGFRNRPEEWPAVLHETAPDPLPWIVLKMSHPICRGELWTRLLEKRYLDRLIVIVAADDLRRSQASISTGLSWELSVQELAGDLAYHAEVRQVASARHLVVNFGHDGALWVENVHGKTVRRRLVFDPEYLEGNWQEGLEGDVVGAGACLPASVARSLFESVPIAGAEEDENHNKPMELRLTDGADLEAGVARGLAARRALLQSGHGTTADETPGFPVKKVLESLQGDRSGGFSMVSVPDFAVPGPTDNAGGGGTEWSIIVGSPVGGHRPLYGRARDVALRGEAALSGIPYGRFGKLYTVDRIELNGYYGIRRLMIDYVAESHPGRPLSLGVFGPPGSGKSFGIKQIARGILGKSVPILTFNLSQFGGPEMLAGALHQVRDEVLKGEVPVVFWDEFDSDRLEWLQFMLAPMNDGEFLEGQVAHPIGKCIFIFAGGTCSSLEEFRSQKTEAEAKAFVAAKGPDFVSRLKGYINVLGPNPREVEGTVDPSDVGFPIRRAIMLRVQAGRFGSAPLSIDPGLLDAMLKIRKFKNGARSMETIVKLTTGNGARELLRSNLPPREQLDLHVDHDEFIGLVRESSRFKLHADELAPHVHKFFLELARKEGWKPDYPMSYEDLPEEIQRDNIAAARRLPDVLSLVGLIVVDAEPGSGPEPMTKRELVKSVIEANVELLAEAEHDGWMRFKLSNGWRHAEKRDNEKKLHPSLVPYKDLREVDRNKDRNAVTHYPEIVARAGFVIRVEGGTEGGGSVSAP